MHMNTHTYTYTHTHIMHDSLYLMSQHQRLHRLQHARHCLHDVMLTNLRPGRQPQGARNGLQHHKVAGLGVGLCVRRGVQPMRCGRSIGIGCHALAGLQECARGCSASFSAQVARGGLRLEVLEERRAGLRAGGGGLLAGHGGRVRVCGAKHSSVDPASPALPTPECESASPSAQSRRQVGGGGGGAGRRPPPGSVPAARLCGAERPRHRARRAMARVVRAVCKLHQTGRQPGRAEDDSRGRGEG
jgi:hypothetical protein